MLVIIIYYLLVTAAQILIEEEMQCVDGNIRCVVDVKTGTIFNVPNFCITDPVFEKIFEELDNKTLEAKPITV